MTARVAEILPNRKSEIGNRKYHALIAGLVIFLLTAAPSLAQNKALFWLQKDPTTSQLGTITNPTINVGTGRTSSLYLWFNKDSAPLGFDGISLDVRLISSNGGSATAGITFDMPSGRWSGATDGVSRTDSGGTGVDDCNAFDFTNTDTLGTVPARLATISITGVTRGTVQVFVCIGAFGIADSGQNAVVWLGFAQGQVSAETLNISGGVSGQCSLVPEAVVNVVPKMGDFDGDGDVDQIDFGRFQACLTGANIAQIDPSCDDARIDADSDVDANDYAIFQNCMSGADVQANPSCVP